MPWHEASTPKFTADVAVYKPHVESAKQWFQQASQRGNSLGSILLLCGPHGCGKSALVTAAAQEASVALAAWGDAAEDLPQGTPAGTPRGSPIDMGEPAYPDRYDHGAALVASAARFVLQHGGGSARLTLTAVGNTPRASSHALHVRPAGPRVLWLTIPADMMAADAGALDVALREAVARGSHFVLEFTTTHRAEPVNRTIAQRWIPVMAIHSSTTVLTLNAVPAGRMRTALNNAARRLRVPASPALIQQAADYADGDLRAALLRLQWLCANAGHSRQVAWPRAGEKRSRTEPATAQSSGSRLDTRDSMYINIARLLTAKRKPSGQLKHVLDELADGMGVPASTVLAWTQQNIPQHTDDMSDLARALDVYADADMVLRAGGRTSLARGATRAGDLAEYGASTHAAGAAAKSEDMCMAMTARAVAATRRHPCAGRFMAQQAPALGSIHIAAAANAALVQRGLGYQSVLPVRAGDMSSDAAGAARHGLPLLLAQLQAGPPAPSRPDVEDDTTWRALSNALIWREHVMDRIPMASAIERWHRSRHLPPAHFCLESQVLLDAAGAMDPGAPPKPVQSWEHAADATLEQVRAMPGARDVPVAAQRHGQMQPSPGGEALGHVSPLEEDD